MAGNTIEISINQRNAQTLNHELADEALKTLIQLGVEEVCVCPGARNSALIIKLENYPQLKPYYWYEERSAAFFALGRSRKAQKPVAIIVTSGTAVGELLPAVMEAHYTHVPLILITADRPKRFRGSGAPQAVEQLDIFGPYVEHCLDVEVEEKIDVSLWQQKRSLHLNLCFEDRLANFIKLYEDEKSDLSLHEFLENSLYPFVIVSTLEKHNRETVVQFLLELNAPVYLEGISGIREDDRLQHLKISSGEKILENARKFGYPIDGVLRIGGIPTLRFWRDIEEREAFLLICNLSDHPYSGLSWAKAPLEDINSLNTYKFSSKKNDLLTNWVKQEEIVQKTLFSLLEKEPRAEVSLIHQLSKKIPPKSLVYLGNSLPIREWDMVATFENREFSIEASRGTNGIDGQISTFLGLCMPFSSNWAIIGDLTALYDMAAPWILPQLPDLNVNIVIINNDGGKIFERMFHRKEFLNSHGLSFEPLAKMWNLTYERWTEIPENIAGGGRLIEIVPDNQATARFWKMHQS